MILGVTYIGLIAVVMSYATLKVEFSQSMHDDEAMVADLEAEYLSGIARVSVTDYAVLGYTKPVSKTFVTTKKVVTLR